MSEDIRKMIDKVKTFKQFVNENSVFETDEIYKQLVDMVKNSVSFDEFKTKVIYYGYTKLMDVNVDSLTNTEKISGLPVITKSPIRVGQDIKTNKMYIIDGHNRVKKAKDDGENTIKAYVTRGKIDRKGQFNLEPETSIYVDMNNINLENFYEKFK
jgi:hypothetical protein